MEPEPSVLDSLRAAVAAMPDDVPLRMHLASLLLQAGQRDEAVRHLGAVLQRDPGNATALSLLTGPTSAAMPRSPQTPPPAAPPTPPDPGAADGAAHGPGASTPGTSTPGIAGPGIAGPGIPPGRGTPPA